MVDAHGFRKTIEPSAILIVHTMIQEGEVPPRATLFAIFFTSLPSFPSVQNLFFSFSAIPAAEKFGVKV